MAEDWTPAFSGQRPPFEPGNTVGFKPGHELSPTRHGAYSERRLQPIAAELLAEVLADPDVPQYVKATPYRHTLIDWARTEAKVLLVETWLDSEAQKAGVALLLPQRQGQGVTQAESALRLLERLRGHAARLRSELGLTPASAARLGKDVAIGRAADADVAQRMALLAQMEKDLEARGWKRPAEDGDAGDEPEHD